MKNTHLSVTSARSNHSAGQLLFENKHVIKVLITTIEAFFIFSTIFNILSFTDFGIRTISLACLIRYRVQNLRNFKTKS